MRTIKFRAWQKNHKKIGRVKSISFNEESEIEHLCFHNGDNCAPVYSNYWKNHKEWDLDNLELMQFTGQKDKKGVEIYEGDIVNDDDLGKGIVIMQSGCFFMMYDADTNMEFLGIKTDKFGRLQEKRVVEVLGNIHDNPELLSTPTAVL